MLLIIKFVTYYLHCTQIQVMDFYVVMACSDVAEVHENRGSTILWNVGILKPPQAILPTP